MTDNTSLFGATFTKRSNDLSYLRNNTFETLWENGEPASYPFSTSFPSLSQVKPLNLLPDDKF